jgi:hypothetical protein
MFVALPRKVDTMLPDPAERTLPRENLARVEPNRSGFFSPWQKDFSVLSSFSLSEAGIVGSNPTQGMYV